MVATIQQMIAAINPDLYYAVSDDKEKVKKELRDFKELAKKDFNSAAEQAKPKSDADYSIVYDSSSETLEPLYFFILDLMNDRNLAPEKLIDNFTSSPGSGHFSELGQRATLMQQQGTKILGDINVVLRSVLNIIYDLRDFRIRLKSYDDLKSKEEEIREAALLSLKQLWLDKVDILKGNTSIKAMALGQAGFQTLLDAFLVVKDEKGVTKLDLNDRVKRMLLPRVQEFKTWLDQSGKELSKRYNLEKTYLKSQVNSLKLYSKWAKPYLKAASELERKEMDKEPALVKAFNTIILEMLLLGKSKIDPREAAIKGNLPKDFEKLRIKRDYYSCLIVEFRFRGIPQRMGGQQPHYVFGGRVEITFSAYALNQDELDKLHAEMDKADVEDVLKLIEGTTTESIEQLQDDINSFLEEVEEEEKLVAVKDQSNPFMAIVGGYDKKEKKSSEKENKIQIEIKIRSDNYIEKSHLRPYAVEEAKNNALSMFETYKKAHGMVSFN